MRRSWLLSSAAILLAGCLAFSAPAWAVDECGTGSSVTCDSSDPDYATNFPNGIDYFPAADLTMVVQDGVTINSGGNEAIEINFSTPADLDLRLYDTDVAFDVSTTGTTAHGIYVRDASYIVLVNEADIATSGSDANGIYILLAREDVALTLSGSLRGELALRLGKHLWQDGATQGHASLDAGLRHEFSGETQAVVSGLTYSDELPGTLGFLAANLDLDLLAESLKLGLRGTYAKGDDAEEITATGALRVNY